MVVKRLLLAVIGLLIAGLVAPPGRVLAQQTQTFAHGQFWVGDPYYGNGASGDYGNKIIWPPALPNGSGLWSAGPLAVSNQSTMHVEAGPAHTCRNDSGQGVTCSTVLYTSYRTCLWCTVGHFDFSRPVAPGTAYTFQVISVCWGVSCSLWQPLVYYSGAWLNLAAAYFGVYGIELWVFQLPFVSSGGESSCPNCPMGTYYQDAHQYRTGTASTPGYWWHWCHNYDNKTYNGQIYPPQGYCYGNEGWYSYN